MNENRFFVGAQGPLGDDAKIVIMRPPTRPISRDDAINLAAWLVALADPLNERFPAVLAEVRET